MAGTRRPLDVAALAAVEDELAAAELARSQGHARTLRAVRELARVHRAAGMELMTVAALGLSLGCSEHRAQQLMTEMQLLTSVPDGLSTTGC